MKRTQVQPNRVKQGEQVSYVDTETAPFPIFRQARRETHPESAPRRLPFSRRNLFFTFLETTDGAFRKERMETKHVYATLETLGPARPCRVRAPWL